MKRRTRRFWRSESPFWGKRCLTQGTQAVFDISLASSRTMVLQTLTVVYAPYSGVTKARCQLSLTWGILSGQMSVVSNFPVSAIDTPQQPLLEKIAEAVYLIAPEPKEALTALLAKFNWEYELDGNSGGFCFAARQGKKHVIYMPLANLERLWAFVFGHLVLFELARAEKSRAW